MATEEATSPWVLKAVMLLLHVVFVGGIVALDTSLLLWAKDESWLTATYVVLLVLTLVQYYLTSGSYPGHVNDVVIASSDMQIHRTTISKESSLKITNNNHGERGKQQASLESWKQLVTDLYPLELCISSREWICSYCGLFQPPRSKHCHDCDKCILQYDHHCIWLSTCIGKKNHCRFWWYIFEETILSVWTAALYFRFLLFNANKALWREFVAVLLLAALTFISIFLLLLLIFHSYLVLTNQTTYEVARRRRIFYLKGVPGKVHPFSEGICRNLYLFCCSGNDTGDLEAVPPMEALISRANAHTFLDCGWCSC